MQFCGTCIKRKIFDISNLLHLVIRNYFAIMKKNVQHKLSSFIAQNYKLL